MGFFNSFLIYAESEKLLSKNTISAYKRDLTLFCENVRHPIQKITCDDILSFSAYLKFKCYAESSICRAIVTVKLFFAFLKKEGVIDENPCAKYPLPKCWNRVPEVLSKDEAIKLIDQPNTNTICGLRDKAILELLYGCGLRVSELCTLKIHDLQDDHLHVLGKGNKHRIQPIGKKALEAIHEYLPYREGKDDSLFVSRQGYQMDRTFIWKMIKGYAKKSGITKCISPHTLRHSFASHLLDNGAELRIIQELLGHSTINSTERYTHISKEQISNSFKKFHKRFK